MPLREHLDKVPESRLDLGRRGHLHLLEGTERRDADPDTVRADGFNDGLRDFQREPRAVYDGAAVLVRSSVGVGLQELVEQVAVGAVMTIGTVSGSWSSLGRRVTGRNL